MGENVLVPLSISKLIDSQYFCVLGSIMDRIPYSNLMAFIPWQNYRYLIFATARNTRKYHNLLKNPACSVFIDNRRNEIPDCLEAKGICACGDALEMANGTEKDDVIKNYIQRHPTLTSFVKSPSVALFQMKVETYYFVENFQEVIEVHFDQ